ncbi:MAG: O-antigen ligase family protein [Gemmatimonadaceae bacterium]
MAVARWLLHATVLVPLILIPGFYFAFVTTRAVYFRVLVELATAVLVVLLLRHETKLDRRDWIFWALVAFLGANTLAAIVGPSPLRSVFGDFERMGGVWSWLHFLAYYVALRTFFDSTEWVRYFRNVVVVGAVVSLLALIQYRGDVLGLGFKGADAGATLGNPGFLAAYLLGTVAVALLLARRSHGIARLGYFALVPLFVATIVLSANRSSLVGGLAGVAFGFLVYWRLTSRLTPMRAAAAGAFVFVVAMLPLLARTSPARAAAASVPVLSRLAGTSATGDPSRVTQWQAALGGIRQRPLFGYGPENYHLVWSENFQPEMYGVLGSDDRWDRAHNAYLDAFTSAGVLGFAALVAIWLLLFRAVTKRRTGHELDPGDAAIAAGFFAAYAFFLFFWFFDLNSTFLWLALAAFVTGAAGSSHLLQFGTRREPRWQTNVVLGAGGLVLAAALYIHAFETLRTLRVLHHAEERDRPVRLALRDFQAVFSSPAPATYHAYLQYSSYLRWLQPHFDDIRSDPRTAAAMDSSLALAFRAVEQEIKRDPLNERLAIQKGRIALLAASYYRDARYSVPALESFQRAVELAPRRVQPRLVLGNVLLVGGYPQLALREFEGAYAAYPPLGQTHAYIGEAYFALGRYVDAAAWLKSASERGFEPRPELIAEVLGTTLRWGYHEPAAELGTAYLYRRHGPFFLWHVSRPQIERLRNDREVIALTQRALDAAHRPEAAALSAASGAACAPLPPLTRLAPLTSAPALQGEGTDCGPIRWIRDR